MDFQEFRTQQEYSGFNSVKTTNDLLLEKIEGEGWSPYRNDGTKRNNPKGYSKKRWFNLLKMYNENLLKIRNLQQINKEIMDAMKEWPIDPPTKLPSEM